MFSVVLELYWWNSEGKGDHVVGMKGMVSLQREEMEAAGHWEERGVT